MFVFQSRRLNVLPSGGVLVPNSVIDDERYQIITGSRDSSRLHPSQRAWQQTILGRSRFMFTTRNKRLKDKENKRIRESCGQAVQLMIRLCNVYSNRCSSNTTTHKHWPMRVPLEQPNSEWRSNLSLANRTHLRDLSASTGNHPTELVDDQHFEARKSSTLLLMVRSTL